MVQERNHPLDQKDVSAPGTHESSSMKAVTTTRKEKLAPTLQRVDFDRGMGIILPIFSLPSDYGIGSFGQEAYRFCDFLAESKMKYWQLLPLGQTSYGDSPYSSFSSYAGNPYFIDLNILCEEGLLNKEELEPINFGDNPEYVNYALQYNNRFRILEKAFHNAKDHRLKERQEFFKKNKSWLEDHALFMAIKKDQLDVEWTEWPEDLKHHQKKALKEFAENHKNQLEFQYFIQFKFFEQWETLKNYAHRLGIQLIGDMPIYVAMDSVDVWANADQFLLDDELKPTVVAGAPPDFFTKEGQRWGNPIYDWDKMKANDYDFWKKRVKIHMDLYDILRLDHFIGFGNYWSVPAEDETARNGYWVDGPGMDLFQSLEKELGPLPFLIEDLGVLSDKVIDLREETGFVGMNPIQFAFGEDNSEYLPHNLEFRSSIYTSTHDSDTLMGWWKDLDLVTREYATQYFGLNEKEGILWGIVRGVASSVADICIVQMQDILGLDNESRMNVPGLLGGNWKWRMGYEYFDRQLMMKLRDIATLYGRN